MFLLDTDFLSQTVKHQPRPEVLRWLRGLVPGTTYLSVINLEEIGYGLELMPQGRRRTDLTQWRNGLSTFAFANKILPVTKDVAEECGRLRAQAKRQGHTAALGAALIAATANMHGLRVATLNRKHYEQLGIDLVDLG